MKEVIEVVGAVIVHRSKILCTQRSAQMNCAHQWEFPGGKVEEHESAEVALMREIREELNCEVEVGSRITRTLYTYPSGTIALTTYFCALTDGMPELLEHESMRWLSAGELHQLDWAPADIPTVDLITQSKTSK